MKGKNKSIQSRQATTVTKTAAQAVPPGYKRTEVGVIPEDWEVDRIDRYASIKTGSKNTQDRIEDGEYPFFVRSQQVERINSYSHEGEAVLTAGDGVGTGKVFHYIDGRFDVHQRVYQISDFSPKLNGRYFYYQFSSRFYDRIMSMTAKSSVDSVRKEMIAGMKIPLPPPAEQRTIAEALSDVDELIEALDKLIAKKRAIKQAAMQQLLTGKTRLPGFQTKLGYKRTVVGVIPEDWGIKRLGSMGKFLKGKGISRAQAQSGPFPCVRYGEIYTVHNDYIKEFHSWISEEVAATATPLQKGDILFTGSGETKEEIGKSVTFLHELEAYAGGDIIILRPGPLGVDSLFLGYVLNSEPVRQQKASKGQGDAVVHITANALADIMVALPEIKEQTAIAAVLFDMDAEIEALERRRDKVKQIKQGMMQELLTGRIRLTGAGAHQTDSS